MQFVFSLLLLLFETVSGYLPLRGSSILCLRKKLSCKNKISSIYKEEFPILNDLVNYNLDGHPLVYLDNAATTQVPSVVMSSMVDYLSTSHGSVGKSNHLLGNKATLAYQNARIRVQQFVGAASPEEIIFTKGATDSLNILADSLVNSQQISSADEIILTTAEHKSNILPWQRAAARTGATIRYIPLTHQFGLDYEYFASQLSHRTRIVSFAAVSNVIGLVNDIQRIINLTRTYGGPDVKIIMDGCQYIPHLPVSLRDLDVDFCVWSAHKHCGPAGIGILYGKYSQLTSLVPAQSPENSNHNDNNHSKNNNNDDGHGSMITSPIEYFERGTPSVVLAVGLSSAIDFFNNTIGFSAMATHNTAIMQYLEHQLRNIPEVTLLGPSINRSSNDSSSTNRLGLISFTVSNNSSSNNSSSSSNNNNNNNNISCNDIATHLSCVYNICVRGDSQCAPLLHRSLSISSSCRVSCYFYNSQEDIDLFIQALKETIAYFKSIQ